MCKLCVTTTNDVELLVSNVSLYNNNSNGFMNILEYCWSFLLTNFAMKEIVFFYYLAIRNAIFFYMANKVNVCIHKMIKQILCAKKETEILWRRTKFKKRNKNILIRKKSYKRNLVMEKNNFVLKFIFSIQVVIKWCLGNWQIRTFKDKSAFVGDNPIKEN